MSKALPDFEQLLKEIAYGTVDATFEIHGGQAIGVKVYGRKTNLYNRKPTDERTNQTALQDIAQRILSPDQTDQVLTIHVKYDEKNHGKIRSVVFQSQKKKNYPIG